MNTSPPLNTLLTITILALGGCSAEKPATETGYHEYIPGSFEYFVDQNPYCSSTSSDSSCTYEYDEYGRLTQSNCPSLIMTNHYENSGLREETVFEFPAGVPQEDPAPLTAIATEYTLEVGRVVSAEKTSTFMDGDVDHEVKTYARNELGQVERIDIVDSDNQHASSKTYSYDEDTGHLTRSEFLDDLGDVEIAITKEFVWTDGLLTEQLETTSAYQQGTAEWKYFYDEDSRLIRSELTSTVYENEEPIVTTYEYDCNDL